MSSICRKCGHISSSKEIKKSLESVLLKSNDRKKNAFIYCCPICRRPDVVTWNRGILEWMRVEIKKILGSVLSARRK